MPDDREQAPSPAAARPLLACVCVAALTALLGAYCAARFEITSDIGYFLPEGGEARAAGLLRQLSRSALSQRMVLTLGGADPDTLARASEDLARRLATYPEFARVRHGVDAQAQRDVFELYFPRRFHLFSETPEDEYAQLLSDAGLQRAAGRLLSELSGVRGPLVRRIASEDPLLTFARVMERLDRARVGGLQLRDGVFFSPDTRYAVLFVETRDAALDAAAQRKVLDAIAREFTIVERAHGARLALEQSGVNRYAVHAEGSIRADIQRISTVSSVALLVLFVGLFRSLRTLLLVSLPPLLGMLVATAATLALFGHLHGATLAFGTTLIGVCVDYPVHLIAHHTLGPAGRAAHATLRTVWPALFLGSLTTIAGLLGFGVATLPGIREMAFFVGIGVVTSLLVTRFVLPHLLGPGGHATRLQQRIAERLGRATGALIEHRRLCVGLLCGAVALCVVGLPALRFQDDLSNWVPAPAALRAEDERVQARVLASEPGRIVVTSAPDLASALAANDQVAGALADAVRAQELGDFRSLHSLIWSEPLQRRNLRALQSAPALRDRLTRALDAAGFETAEFAAFFTARDQPASTLGLPQLLASALGPIASAFVLDLRDQPAFATYLRGVRDPKALERRLSKLPGAHYFDQREFLRTTYAAFRTRAIELMAFGLIAVFGIVLLRYRALRPSLAAVLPAALAAGGALAALALFGVKIDLFHVVGLLLVLSMGEDYGVFLVESHGAQDLAATMLALVLACASTVLSFGLLALSEVPALRSLGQVISIGMLLALLWAPAGLVLLPSRGARA